MTPLQPSRWTIPNTGRPLPAFGFGCAALGNLYAAVSDADAAATLSAAWQNGIAYFDTAPYYGHGLSEERLGRFLKSGAAPHAIVSTKVGRSLRPVGDGVRPDTGFVNAAPFDPYFDYSSDAVLRQIEGSLARLGHDRLDIVFVHDIGARTHGPEHKAMFTAALKGAFPALAELRSQGVIGAIGIGVNEVEVCIETMAHVRLDAILLAGRYTLLDQSALPELLPCCERDNVAVIVGGPFNSGVLADGRHYDYAEVPAAIAERAARLRAVCAEHGVPLTAAALHFPLLYPAIVSVIPGARTAREVTANAADMAAPPPASLWNALRAEGLIAP
ncbi:MAG TPA: aldo/keto reductase [Rhizomicrobium sp.]|nr:aldo/keto reductase [Rhizomicrobium sp.]